MPNAIRRIRPFFFWLHLSIGVAAGTLILLMSVTGVLLGFERQTIAWWDGAPAVATGPAGATQAMELDAALSSANVDPASLASVALRNEPTAPVTLRFRDRERAAELLDPYTGALLPPRAPGQAQAFFSAIRRWHRWVGATGAELRATMRAATGASNLAFVVLILSGISIWWPRRWTRARIRATTLPSLTAKGRGRDHNWHHALGIWMAIPLLVIAVTGVFISYQWPGRTLDRWLGSPEERAAARAPIAPPTVPRDERPSLTAAAPVRVDALLRAAVGEHPAWRTITITLPERAGADARVAIADGNGYRPDLRTTLTIDAATATIVTRAGYDDLSASRRIRSWMRFGHTGEVFGIPGQLLATLASLAAVVLTWTGLALSWRRAILWKGSRARSAAPEAPCAPAPVSPS